ncbi:uncharacterized protein NEMAJ01_0437 [Nematocida major]|uniref:uncharacterized protein n=1 Tax=Nematocida major TaxID=1912982 RepID=UPI0020089623|nr:uncharacterized protein NEMAJ01_0437 [Nematocida major]KAH9385541.1 hypothetical protein NEMAJ01_0437 [Nematocida major]
MGFTRKKDQTKGKICKERIKSLEFVEEDREAYLNSMKKRRVTAKKKRHLMREEEKKEAKREKRREQKKRELERADLAQKVLESTQGEKEEVRMVIGSSIVTIKEL